MLKNKKISSRLTSISYLLLLLLTVLFLWKILLTRQFSLLVWEENVRQWYSWLNFAVVSFKDGTLPIWDPYTSAGFPFAAEMQTGVFNPLTLLLVLIPLNKNGVLSPQLFHQFYALIHFLAACFMFALVRQIGLSRFAAIIAGICFSLGGFLINVSWAHIYGSAIWLPLIFLFLIRAIDARTVKRCLLHASAGGLMMGMAVLAGGIHVVIMQALVVLSFAAFIAFSPQMRTDKSPGKSSSMLPVAIVTVLIVGICAGAVQLLPSMEYSSQALRWLGGEAPPLLADSKIPYAYLRDSLEPDGFLSLLFGRAVIGNNEAVSPYIGVFPLLAAIIGILRCWHIPWVRYLAGLALVTFLYSLGAYSLFHGVLYAVVPRLWMAREAGRFIYLLSFAMPILAAYGIDYLFGKPAQKPNWKGLNRVFAGIVIACAAILTAATILGRPDINSWMAFSILMVFLSYGMFQAIIRGKTGTSMRTVLIVLILFDLHAFYWQPRNKIEEAWRGNVNHLDRLMSCRGAADFLKTQPAPFRVRIDDDPKPNIGHLFQVPTIHSTGVTSLKDFAMLSGGIQNLLNVRYILKPASSAEPGAMFEDDGWKVYANPESFPPAWIVHETVTDPSPEGFLARLNNHEIDLYQTAVLSEPLDTALESVSSGVLEKAEFRAYTPNRLELDVQSQGRGLLVLSEIFYPGWSATVNGKKQKIHKVNGILRGVTVPGSRSHVVLQYRPISVYAGGLLSLATFSAVGFALFYYRRRRNSTSQEEPLERQ